MIGVPPKSVWRVLTALVCCLVAFSTLSVHADEIRPAVVEMAEREEGKWSLSWTLPVSSINVDALSNPLIPKGCTFTSEPVRRAGPTALYGSAQLQCSADLSGQQFGLSSLFGNADAIARFDPVAEPSQTFRLTSQAPTATIAAQPSRWQVGRSYFVIGVEHILMGWDHLLFVIALVLLVRRGWAVVKAATAFTIAHSLTLIATTLGYAGLPSRPVEALIALSILFLAVELTKGDHETWTRRAPWLVAFAFGLLHGFGFAGALSEIGLPQGEVPMALLAFNLGVEAGQLLVVAVLMALLAIVGRVAPRIEQPGIRIATYGIGITASYWLIERTIL